MKTPARMKLFGKKSDKVRQIVAEGLETLLPRIWRMAYSLSMSPDIADELTQDTCVRALSKAAQFQAGTRLDSWVFTICRSIWLNDLRAGKRRRAGGILPIEDVEVADPAPTTEMNIFASQIVGHVMALPEAQRETVVLVYVEGFTYREASEILGIPVGTVMSRLSVAREKLAPLKSEDTREAKQV